MTENEYRETHAEHVKQALINAQSLFDSQLQKVEQLQHDLIEEETKLAVALRALKEARKIARAIPQLSSFIIPSKYLYHIRWTKLDD